MFSYSTQGLRGSIPPGGGFEIAADLVSDAFDLLLLIRNLIVTQGLGTSFIYW
jgi:hypothetical protein